MIIAPQKLKQKIDVLFKFSGAVHIRRMVRVEAEKNMEKKSPVSICINSLLVTNWDALGQISPP